MLQKVPLFEHCSKQNLEEIAGIAEEIDLKEGKVLMREGTPGYEFFVLLEGAAEVTQGSEHVRTLGPGDFFGEIALVSKIPRTATVTTTSPVHALWVSAQNFRSLVDRQPTVALQVLEAAVERMPTAV